MWSILYVTDWDFEAGEAVGGRCLGERATFGEAVKLAEAYRHTAVIQWGPGFLAVTTPEHELAVMMSPAGAPSVVDRLHSELVEVG